MNAKLDQKQPDHAAAPILLLEDVCYAYNPQISVLQGINAALYPGELVALIGASGLGKSTLLHIAGLMETPTSGTVSIQQIQADTEAKRTRLRREHIGFVFQFHHLLPEFTAWENVTLVGRIGGQSVRAARQEAKHLLERVGLGARLNHLPANLSGGECQRVAIARALINTPALLLLDEPTGNLDSQTADNIFHMIKTLVHEKNLACLYVTHNQAQAQQADKRVSLVNQCWTVMNE